VRWNHACPQCKAGLNPGETVILVGECGDIRCLVGLHPEPGDYRAYLPPGVEARSGSQWTFRCPVCGNSLAAPNAPRLCLLDGFIEGKRCRVYFSSTAGERATFVIDAEGEVKSHGRDAPNHPLDLLGLI
jgi:hypothetical protein